LFLTPLVRDPGKTDFQAFCDSSVLDFDDVTAKFVDCTGDPAFAEADRSENLWKRVLVRME